MIAVVGGGRRAGNPGSRAAQVFCLLGMEHLSSGRRKGEGTEEEGVITLGGGLCPLKH